MASHYIGTLNRRAAPLTIATPGRHSGTHGTAVARPRGTQRAPALRYKMKTNNMYGTRVTSRRAAAQLYTIN